LSASPGRRIEVVAVEGIGEIGAGDPLGGMLAAAASPDSGDVLVVSQKAVSKAEGRTVALDSVTPGGEAMELGRSLGKDPRLVELILRESARIVRAERGVLIVETRSGWVCANAGIDASNVPGEGRVVLLPADPDASARRLRAEIESACGARPAVIVSDSFGRPWRLGQTDVAIGCAGIAPAEDWRGRADREGRSLAATVVAVADELAAAGDLVRPKDGGTPAALVRGAAHLVTGEDGPGAAALRRPADRDLFT
jgi:coenzyme F420-0:L-glutamate ligase/coenzyme F420-1:gamma-L-glutamate ligase